MQFPTLYPTFFTATCNNWLHLLQDVQCKDIIINSLSFLVEKQRIRVLGFVIMNNHLVPLLVLSPTVNSLLYIFIYAIKIHAIPNLIPNIFYRHLQ